MSGFIYIWRDNKTKRYYVGSHWGHEEDGYVCSSPWVNKAYKKRPEDFKRRILERFNDRTKIDEIEHRWLQMMKPEELKGKRYYNFHNFRFGHWSTDEHSRLSVRQKISAAKKNPTQETRDKISAAFKGKPRSQETRDKISAAFKGKPWSQEHRNKASMATRGKIVSQETRDKISATLRSKKLRPIVESR